MTSEFASDKLRITQLVGATQCKASQPNDAGDRIWIACTTRGNASDVLDSQWTSDSSHIFVAQFNSDGAMMRSFQLGSTDLKDRVEDLVVDWTRSDIYIVGATKGAFDGQSHIGPSSTYDAFVTRVKFDGTRSWTRIFGTERHDQATSIAYDGTADLVYVGGWMNSTTETSAQTSNLARPFVYQFTGVSGVQQWQRVFLFQGEVRSLTLVPSRNVFVASLSPVGNMTATWTQIRPDGLIVAETSLPSADPGRLEYIPSLNMVASMGRINELPIDGTTSFGGEDAWMTFFELPSLTRKLISIRWGTPRADSQYGYISDGATGESFLLGNSLGNFTATNKGLSDLVLIKFNGDGTLDWKTQIGSSGEDAFQGGLFLHNRVLFFAGQYNNQGFLGTYQLDLLPSDKGEPADIPMNTPSPTPGDPSSATKPLDNNMFWYIVIGGSSAGFVVLVSAVILIRRCRKGRMEMVLDSRFNMTGSRSNDSRLFYNASQDW